jgi:pantetheine-phosphate adenylyltransferase
MAQTNRRIFPELQSVMLFTPAEYSDISSSTVRELLKFGRNVEEMMPEGIKLENYFRKE